VALEKYSIYEYSITIQWTLIIFGGMYEYSITV